MHPSVAGASGHVNVPAGAQQRSQDGHTIPAPGVHQGTRTAQWIDPPGSPAQGTPGYARAEGETNPNGLLTRRLWVRFPPDPLIVVVIQPLSVLSVPVQGPAVNQSADARKTLVPIGYFEGLQTKCKHENPARTAYFLRSEPVCATCAGAAKRPMVTNCSHDGDTSRVAE